MRYLRSDKLLIGDVLLIKSRGKPGAVVSLASGGQYSHAAIYAGFTRIFEALTTGVGYSSFPVSKIEIHNDGWHTFCDVSSFERIDVFRLPEIARPEDHKSEAFRDRFTTLLWEYNGLEYSLLERLAHASSLGRAIPTFAGLVMRVFGTVALGDAKKRLPGPFCSELVVEALSQAGFKLLSEARKSSTVSPNDLSNPAVTYLEPVNDCFDCVDDAIPAAIVEAQLLASARWPSTNTVHQMRLRKKLASDLVSRYMHMDG
jgi:hypothetical protein